MRLILLIILLLCSTAAFSATSYTEFFCDATASANNTNINAGSTTGAAVYTSIHGNWDGTSVFIPTDGTTPANTVSAGMWMSVFVDGATNLVQTSSGGWICLITNVAAGVNGAITIDRAAFAGTAPTSSVNARSVRVGGCWQGPYRIIGFPFGFMATTATNGPNNRPRVNFNNASTYNITAAMTHNVAGPVRFEGYTSSAGDGGKALIDGGTAVAGYVVLTIGASGLNGDYVNLKFNRNGNTGSSIEVTANATARCLFQGCVFSNARGIGLQLGQNTAVECETFGCNVSTTAATGSIFCNANGGLLVRCLAHDNSAANTCGVRATASITMVGCISAFNATSGLILNGGLEVNILSCDFYANQASGIEAQSDNEAIYIENCNFVKNTAWGITNNGTLRNGSIVNCGFGAGSVANGLGDISNPGAIQQTGNISYAAEATPWVNPASGDFRIILTAAKAAGRGVFTDTETSAGTVGYPDIGAAQSASTNGGFGATFAQ